MEPLRADNDFGRGFDSRRLHQNLDNEALTSPAGYVQEGRLPPGCREHSAFFSDPTQPHHRMPSEDNGEVYSITNVTGQSTRKKQPTPTFYRSQSDLDLGRSLGQFNLFW